jgi:phosphoglycolate phosphatase-like HAD superfamily hydrolase
MTRLVLWDIDGTLVHGGTSGTTGVAAAYRDVTGQDLAVPMIFEGQTDLGIFRSLIERSGLVADDAVLARVPAAMTAAFGGLADELARTGYAMPGAAAAIAHVGDHVPGVRQSVLTGNVRPNAELKLRTFGLADAIDFEIGAYGADAELRHDLVPVAVARANAKYAAAYAPTDVVLVGDTPRDVAAALAHGAHVIGVATGGFDAGRLHAEGAHAVLADLTDLDALRAAFGALTGRGRVRPSKVPQPGLPADDQPRAARPVP